MKRNNFLFLMLVTLAGFAPPAFAYLDPSTGSMILSAIVGLFATMALAVKTYWYKLKAFFRRDSSKAAVDEAEKDPASGEATTEN
jgi:hypothetical protein